MAPRRYWWFRGESVAELTKRLHETENARLEVHLAGDKMTLEVVDEGVVTTSRTPPINESHVCPPQCP